MRENNEQELKDVETTPATEESTTESYSLNDDRRVKVLSPTALVLKRFFRNRIAVVGLCILVFMFLFCFVGGWISPYGENEYFFTTEEQLQEYVAATENTDFRYLVLDDTYGAVAKAMTGSAINSGDTTFTTGGYDYLLVQESEEFYTVYIYDLTIVAADGSELDEAFQTKALEAYEAGGGSFKLLASTYTVSADGEITTGGTVYASIVADQTLVGGAYLGIIAAEDNTVSFSTEFSFEVQMAYAHGGGSFEYEGETYEVDEDGVITCGGEDVAAISTFIVSSATVGRTITANLRAAIAEAIDEDLDSFQYVDEAGEIYDFVVDYAPSTGIYSIKMYTATRVYDTYSFPTLSHWLGTDKYGMDMLSRVMYGGRISLVVGFIVVFIELFLGVILGGISGYFGKWVDQLIMRIVDVFYCIPSTPLIIILGAAMDNMQVKPLLRVIYLMLILGFLGWPSIARMVRGQILSFREQEFMTAAEACGIRSSRRIFRHLIPNVIPQLIVIATMSVGGTILTEATLSYLGLGVKFPFASWGSIINDVSNSYVLTTYWFIWIPAGICLMLTVLGFNFVGDGLRDAFDPKMKR